MIIMNVIFSRVQKYVTGLPTGKNEAS